MPILGPKTLWLIIPLLVSKIVLLLAVYFSNPAANPIQYIAYWDYGYFAQIANSGYTAITDYAFALLYPFLIRVGMLAGAKAWASGFMITNAFSFVFPLIIYKLYDFKTALISELFPIYLVYGLIPYSDTIALTFLALSLYLLSRNRNLTAGLSICMSLISAYTIVWLLPSLVLLVRKKNFWNLVRLSMPIFAVLIAIVTWFTISSGTPYVYFDAQKVGWGASFVNPQSQFQYLLSFNTQRNLVGANELTIMLHFPQWRSLYIQTKLTQELLSLVTSRLYWIARNLLFEVFYGALTVVLFLRKQRFESAFAVSAMIPLFFIGSDPSLSIPRHLLTAFPAMKSMKFAPLLIYGIISVACAILILWLQLYTFFG